MSRLQLRAKGDDGTYANITSVVLAAGSLFIPATHWLVDRRGYAVTLATVNVLGLLCCIFQVSRLSSRETRPYFSHEKHFVNAGDRQRAGPAVLHVPGEAPDLH